MVLLLILFLAGEATAQDLAEGKPFFNQQEWTVENSLRVNLGSTAPNALVVLLSSVAQHGESGAENPLFGVELLVVSGGRCLFRLSEAAPDAGFFIDNSLEATDVTSDAVPEVLFHSGFVGASDWSSYEHVLHLTDDGRIEDVAIPQFVHSWRYTFRWLAWAGTMLGLVADPVDVTNPEDPRACHGCPKLYHYLVFKWQPSLKKFALACSMESLRDFTADLDPLVEDLPEIQKGLASRCTFQAVRLTTR